jgi:uncharacterized Zn finger protein
MTRRRSSYYDGYWPQYTASKPIPTRDGIKAKSQRGKFVENWWANRWIDALKRLMDEARLRRGRSYARQGQVLNLDIGPGEVGARVQGSRRSPYRVSIRLPPLTDRDWDKVFDALAEQAIYAAQLLNGEMPPDIDQVFEAVGVALFPSSRSGLETDCSCPDWANPCKHIAAVHYLLGERFDADPFLLFLLRGRSREEITSALRRRRAQGPEMLGEAATPYVAEAVEAVEAANLDAAMEDYWALGPGAEEVSLRLGPPQVDMALLKRLGVPDFANGASFWAQMKRVYGGVAQRAIEVAFAPAGIVGPSDISDGEQLAVLRMVQEGKLSVEEAEALFQVLEG